MEHESIETSGIGEHYLFIHSTKHCMPTIPLWALRSEVYESDGLEYDIEVFGRHEPIRVIKRVPKTQIKE